MRNAILWEKTHSETPHPAPAARLGGTSRVDEGKPASAKPRRGARLCKKAVLWLVAAVLPAFAAAAVPSTEQSSTTVDILVAFDRNAAAYANRNGGVADFALTAVAKMNTVLANNALDEQFRFRLVGTMEVAAEATDVHAALEAIRDSETGWAEIKTKRDEVGADIVTTLIDTGSAYGTTGASWPLTTMDYSSFADSAYNVCAVRAVEIGHAMTREVGHNMGAGNATEVADPDIRGPQLHDYSSGYYFTATNGTRYHTIMADSADGYGNTYALAPLFSSHTASWDGTSAGDATHDNARTLRATCAAVSNWREQKVPLSYDVFFSPEADTLFDEAVMVTLTPGKAGLDIRYTTDSSEPTLTSVRYSTPLKLTRTTTVKAAAVYDGRLGPVFTARYLKRDLATALNAPQLEWTTSPDSPWVAQSDDAFDGFAAKSCPEFVGVFGCGKTSWLKTTVTGPTEMGFRYQKRMRFSAFNVSCDDQVVWSDSETESGIGAAVWHQVMVSLPEGTHEITFAFEQGIGYYGGVFNGVVLDTVCFDTWSASPVIEPATTTDQATAKTFTGSMTVTLTPPAGRTGVLFYTLDGSDPTQEGALPYTGPFTVDKSVFVQAVFVEPGREASASARGYFLERHPMKPGEWTTDVEGVKEAAARDGRLIAVLMAHRADCDWTKALMPVAESPEFLTWAEMNGVYLITADDSERVDTEAAKNYFRNLYSGQDAIFPTLVFADPSNPDVPLASGVARNDGVATIGGVAYDGTVESLVRGFAAVMDETSVLAAPTASPESELVAGFPVMVTLENPNAKGTIYYTLDGSAPTLEKGTRYAGPIKIVYKEAVLRAAVRLDSGLSGLVLIKSYKTSSDVVWTTLPTGMTGYGYAVSNLTAGTEIRPDNGGRYALPIGAKVGIYAVAEEGYVIVGTNPYVIDEVTIDTVIDASALPMALPPCVVTVGNFPRGIVAWTSGDGSVTNVIDSTGFMVPEGTENVKVIFTAKPGYELVGDTAVDLGTVTMDIAFGSGSGYKLPSVRTLPVEYVDADGVVREKAFGEFTKVTASTKKLADGKWYAVIDDVTLTNSLPVEGSAHLILCDWATLAITNSTAEAAISVGDGASLAIYGQTADTGRLAVSGGNAGIGGKTSGVCGAIAIHGGTISASAMSNKYAAGIGSGALGSGGSVTITGGRITAQGGTGAEDIGSGRNATSPCEVFISGGVFAREPDDDWLAPGFAAVTNTDVATAAEYPYAVLPTYPVSWNENTDKMSVLVQMGGETVTDNPVTVLAGDAVEFIVLPKGEYEYAAVPEGWSLRPDGCICNRFEVVDGSIEVTIPEPTLKPYTITYTTGNGTLVTNGVTRYTIETETFSLPSDSDIDMNGVVDVTLRGWKNAAGKVVTEVVKGTSGDLEFFARWASTVSTCQISWNENPGKVSVRAQVDGFDITDNPATVAAGDVVEFIVMPKPGYGYEVAPEGWSLRTDGGICNRFEVVDDSIEVKIPDPTGEPITYTITYFDYGEWIDGFEPVTEYTFETETFNLPVAGDIAPRMGGMFQCWTNEVGETVSEVVRGTEGNLNFYAVWKSAGADPIQAIIGDKVEGFENLPSEKQKAVYDNVQHFYNQFLDVDRTEAWIATVYGEGAKVPAAKFAATTEDLVNVSFKYGLPIMAPPVTIHVTTAAEGLGFTFAITDGDKDAVSVKAANLYGLVKYTASLDDEFHVATDKEVTFDANPDVTFTARFVEGPSAGFMKAELIVPDPAED